MSRYYILKGHEPIPVERATITSFSEDQRRVALTTVENPLTGNADVSTVFLGLDHSFGGGPPQIFETMVFGGLYDEEQIRYSTWDEAVAGHNKMVEAIQNAERAAQLRTRKVE